MATRKRRGGAGSAGPYVQPAVYRWIIDDLRASERRFRDLVDGSIQGILIHRDFAPLFANRACAEMLGYDDPQELTAVDSLERLLAPDECRRIRCFVEDRLCGKDVPPRYELRARRKDGSLFWIELCACVIDWDGRPAIQVSMVDIDERKRAEAELRETQARLERTAAARRRAEESLRESEERFRALFDHSPVSINLKDADCRYLMVNAEWERQNGVDAAGAVGRGPVDIFGEAMAEQLAGQEKRVLETGEALTFESEFVMPDGRRRTRLATKFPVRDGRGAIAGVGTIGLDITERKAMEKALRDSEEQFRALLDNSPLIVSLKDVDGRILMVNREFEQKHDLASGDIAGKRVGELFDETISRAVEEADRRVLETGETVLFEVNFPSPDGTTRTHLTTKFPIRDSSGAITRIGLAAIDITERKRMEKALRDGEEQFRALIDHARAVITLKDRDGRYLMVNPEYERCFGVPAGRAIGAMARDFIPAKAAADVEQRERLVRDSGKPVVAEVSIDQGEGGTPTIYHVVKFPVFDEQGEVVQVGTFSIDITERKRTEEALEASRERFRDFAESSSDWLWESDAEGRLTHVSERIGDLLGVQPALLLGKKRDAFAMPGQEAKWRELEEIIRDRQPIRDFRYAAVGKGGKPEWLKISGRPRFSPTGDLLGYRGTGTNMTNEVQALHREAQVTERFLAAIENVAVAVALFDDQDRLVVANKIYRSQLLTTAHLQPGVTFEQMLRAELDAGGFPEAVGSEEDWIGGRLWRHRNPSGTFELTKSNGLILQIRENRTPDGYTLVVADDITASKQAEQDLIVARDDLEMRVRERTQALEQEILERQYAEQALQEVNAELERRVEERTRHLRDEIVERKKMEAQFVQAQKMEAVGQLAGGIAHDFNNLLTVIQGNLSWLNGVVKADAKTTRMMGMALEAARRAGQLTHRMLAFSRRQDLRPVTVDLRRSLDGMEPLISRALSEAVKLQIDLPESHWPLMVDSHQLESAILNIAINARDAMPNGGTFTLRVENRAVDAAQAARHESVDAGDFVVLSMADTGTGMPPEVLERVFDPFYTTKEVGKGSGLGLSMVFGFVSQSGGFIEITSTEGRGTVVDIYLPRSLEATADIASDKPDASPVFRPDFTVLVVEDDPLVRGVTVEYLKMEGIDALQAGNGQAAVTILEEGKGVDLLLSDVIMPGGMSGLDLAKVVRRRWPKTAILFMSGYSYDEFARHGVDPDTIGLLRKPFTKGELLLKVQEATGLNGGDRDGRARHFVESMN